jgi:hypothetical protein
MDSLDPEIQEKVKRRAVTRLWEWTNKRFGACPVSYRPCRRDCNSGRGYMWNVGVAQGRSISLNCGRCGTSCSCRHVSEVILPGPITPLEILIDGEELDLSAVRVDNYNRLVRIDGGHFPTCQNLGSPPTEEDTWQVTYAKGQSAADVGGDLVAGILACEYAKAMCDDESCRLPKRVSSIQRQGITMAILDDFTKLQTGFTGIWEIDDWIATYTTNLRTGPWQASSVSSPDIPLDRFTTWEYEGS